MTLFVAVLIIANLLFAARELDVILRSRAGIETTETDASLPSLSVIVPARNEADRIERCVRSLLATRHRLRRRAVARNRGRADSQWLDREVVGVDTGRPTRRRRVAALYRRRHASRLARGAIGATICDRSPLRRLEFADRSRDGQLVRAANTCSHRAKRTMRSAAMPPCAPRSRRTWNWRGSSSATAGSARSWRDRDLWWGFVKNFAVGARGQAARAVAGALLIGCVSPISPIVLIVLVAHAAWLPALALAAGMAAVVCAGEFAMRTMRFRPGSGLAVPLGLALTLAIFVTSLVAWHGGSGVVWRGRRYSAGVFD